MKHVQEPEVRRVGFASVALLPPSRARAPLPLWWEGSSGSGGGLCAMLGKPKFVPMARPYASNIPDLLIYLFIPVLFLTPRSRIARRQLPAKLT